MDLLRKGSNWLARTQGRYATLCVSYGRASSSVTVRAQPGRSEFDLQDQQDGFLTRAQSRDYLIDPCELVLDGVPTEPRSGDRIVETDRDGNQWTYEVRDVAGHPCWRWADEYRNRYRIHVKYVGTMPAT